MMVSDCADTQVDLSLRWAHISEGTLHVPRPLSACPAHPGSHCVYPKYSDIHYENTPIEIYRKFHLQQTENFQVIILIFFIFLLKT